MQAKYIERLEQVVRVLGELPREKKFNLARWMTCGTTACACGWAGSDPWFRRRGFRTVKTSDSYSIFYNEQYGFGAVKEFFGLESDKMFYLFVRSYYGRDGSKRAVIRRLNAFIRENREAA